MQLVILLIAYVAYVDSKGIKLPWHDGGKACTSLIALSTEQSFTNTLIYPEGRDECWRIRPKEPSAKLFIEVVESRLMPYDVFSHCSEKAAIYGSDKVVGDTLLKKWCGFGKQYNLSTFNEAYVLLYGGYGTQFKRKLKVNYYQDDRYDVKESKKNSTEDSTFSDVKEIAIVGGASVGGALFIFTILVVYYSMKKGLCICYQKPDNPKKAKKYLSFDK
ncbi:unnamed protein product [Dimorphilus gyrociliatus]|uniref:Uncharacterized protein n=1 Tax=Dimorphilus gyrociliatus TaxID=2664684 RepID=A0A7I8VKQ7_9ANNE|nr:unnamed protein product [Dimorphilus gyrociliatus]